MISKLTFRMTTQLVALALFWLAPLAVIADQNDDKDPVQTGYVIVTPTDGNAQGLVVFETFGKRRGSDLQQAGVVPSSLSTHAVLFVNSNGRLSRNLGAAIVNPGPDAANIDLRLFDDKGVELGATSLTLDPGSQVSAFVTEIFADTPSVPKDLTGTLHIESDHPVGVVGLRFRGENFSTIPVTSLTAPADLPLADGVGGEGSVLLAHFAVGGGWATELVLANSGNDSLTVRVDLFRPDGSEFEVILNGQTASSFEDILIPPRGVVVLTQRNAAGDSDF